MGVNFTFRESCVLYRLLAEHTTDIILKTDREGFVVTASTDIERLGLRLPGGPIGRHLRDLVHPGSAAAIQAAHDAAIAGRQDGAWLEFPALTDNDREMWFQIQIRRLVDDFDRIYGAVSVIRSIEERRTFEERLFTAAMTDQLTGLTNRSAFTAMLDHLVDRKIGGCLAMFDIDHFRAINMRYGHAVGDEVLVVFADLLRTLTRSEDIISRIGGETFGILLPRAAPDHAETICRRIVTTLSDISATAGADSLPITASAGVARIAATLDDTVKAAELALTVAKAKGRNCLQMEGDRPFPRSSG